MLQNMHNFVKGWFSWVLVGGLVLVFALWGLEGLLGGNLSEKPAVEVNGDAIGQHELQVTYERMARQQQEIFAANGLDIPFNQELLKQQALKMLIDEKLLVQAVKQGEYAISSKQLDEQLLNFPEFQENGVFSAERFNQVAASMFLSPAELKQKFYQYVLVDQMRTGLMDSAFALENEVENAIKLIEQKRNVRYLSLSVTNFYNTVNPTQEELQAYYDTHKDNYASPEQVSLDYIVFGNDNLAKDVVITDEDMENYYTANISSYSSQATRDAAHILVALPENASAADEKSAKARIDEYQQRLQKGESFASLAKQYSDDKFSSPSGGNLGWAAYTDVDKTDPVKAAIISLKKVGEVAGPVCSKYGFHLVTLLADKPAVAQPLSAVKDDIRKRLLADRTSELFTQQMDELSTLAFEHPDSLQPAADRFGLKIQQTPLFDKKGGADIASNRRIINAAFSAEVLTQHNNSEPIEIAPQQVAVIRIREHKPAAIHLFADVKQEVRAAVVQQQAVKKVADQADAIVAQLQKGGSGAQATVNIAGAQWVQQTGMTRRDSNATSDAVDAIFRLAKPSSADKPTIGNIPLPTGDRVVAVLTAVQDGVVGDDVKSYADSLMEAQAYTDVMLFAKGLHDRADIVEPKR